MWVCNVGMMVVAWLLGWGGGHMRVLSRIEKKQSLLHLQKLRRDHFALQGGVLQEQQYLRRVRRVHSSRLYCCAPEKAGKFGSSSIEHASALVTCSATNKPRKTVPDVGRESLAEVDVPEAIGELQGAAESEVALPRRRSHRDRMRRGSCGAWRKHSATI